MHTITMGPWQLPVTDEQWDRLKRHNLVFQCGNCDGWHPDQPLIALVAVLGTTGGDAQTEEALTELCRVVKSAREQGQNHFANFLSGDAPPGGQEKEEEEQDITTELMSPDWDDN